MQELTKPTRVLCSKGSPAYCIVMSGGYRDDVDAGLEIDYTGEGGQTNGKHVSCHACCSQVVLHGLSITALLRQWLDQSEAVTATLTSFSACSSEGSNLNAKRAPPKRAALQSIPLSQAYHSLVYFLT